MSEQIEGACCAHMIVRWVTAANTDGTTSGWWACRDCERKFAPVVAPIVMRSLPSDEEIKGAACSCIKDGNCPCYTCQIFVTGFIQGAKWMRDKARQ